MFNEYVLLHTPPALNADPATAGTTTTVAPTVATVAGTAAAAAAAAATGSGSGNNNHQNGGASGGAGTGGTTEKSNIFSTEKMTQAGDGSIWQVSCVTFLVVHWRPMGNFRAKRPCKYIFVGKYS